MATEKNLATELRGAGEPFVTADETIKHDETHVFLSSKTDLLAGEFELDHVFMNIEARHDEPFTTLMTVFCEEG